MNKLVKYILLIPFISLFTSTTVTAAPYTFINGDGSNKSAVCIASTISSSEWEKKAAEFSLGQDELKSFTCNGYSIEKFGAKYRNKTQSPEDTASVKVFAFNNETKGTSTQLCIAGSTSNVDLYNAMKKYNVAKNNVYLIRCNGMSLKRFSKKFGNKRYRV